MRADQELYELLARGVSHGVIVWCPAPADVPAVAAGIVDNAPGHVVTVRLHGDILRPGEGQALLDPLLAGQTLVISAPHGGELAPVLAERWLRWLERPHGTTITIATGVTLTPSLATDRPGIVIVVAPRPERRPDIGRPLELALSVVELSRSNDPLLPPPLTVGVARADAPTIRDLCLLHTRDPIGTQRDSPGHILQRRTDELTWTDLEVVLTQGRSALPLLSSLYAAHRIDDVKLGVAHAALDVLDERKGHGPHGVGIGIHNSIWDVVWDYRWLHDNDRYIFRGQVNSGWPMVSSLFRPTGDGPIDVIDLLTRVDTTDRFTVELKRQAGDMVGGDLADADLLAVAQHYGFATPLLDFTRSFRTAAFFATNRAPGAWDEGVGVIYYMSSGIPGPTMEDADRRRLEIGDFALLDATRINFGAVQIIEPRLPDPENRIARQQGVFVAGYDTRNLQQVSIDRIRFYQRPGEIFDDPHDGITGEVLYTPDSRIAELADEIKARVQARPPRRLVANLAEAHLPSNPIIGSSGVESSRSCARRATSSTPLAG